MITRANKAGAITTLNFGAIESLPTLQQLDS
jgi:fructokinase